MKTKLIAGLMVLALVATAVGVISARNNFGVQLPTRVHQWARDQYNITCPVGPLFAGEEGNGTRGRMGSWMQGFPRGLDFGKFPSTPPDLEG